MKSCCGIKILKQRMKQIKICIAFIWFLKRSWGLKITWNSSEEKTKRSKANYSCPPIITKSSFTYNKITTNKIFSIHDFFLFFETFDKGFFWVFWISLFMNPQNEGSEKIQRKKRKNKKFEIFKKSSNLFSKYWNIQVIFFLFFFLFFWIKKPQKKEKICSAPHRTAKRKSPAASAPPLTPMG